MEESGGRVNDSKSNGGRRLRPGLDKGGPLCSKGGASQPEPEFSSPIVTEFSRLPRQLSSTI